MIWRIMDISEDIIRRGTSAFSISIIPHIILSIIQ